MSLKLANHNDDIRRLIEKGYALSQDGGYLIIRDIPYLDVNRSLQNGAIVTKLVLVDNDRVQQENHQIFFAGGTPHSILGQPIPNMGDSPTTLALSPQFADVVVQRAFSNKPRETGKFADFFEKIESYVAIISGPAQELYGVHPYHFKEYAAQETHPIFKLIDTMTSRAEIADLSAKFEKEIVAIIGLGGTGSYLLDYMVKTPVAEIRGFDVDDFHVHNAFRSPGKLSDSELNKKKADVYAARYEAFRHGLKLYPKIIDRSSEEDLVGVTFAFVCVDKGPSRKAIFDLLIEMKIPFIDVGMGLHRKGGPLAGMMRATYYPPDQAAALRDLQLAELNDTADNLYRTGIQISELNALNASLAMIQFKKIRGFYAQEQQILHLVLGVEDLGLAKETNFG